MHNREKYPEIWASFERATARKAELMAARAPFTEQIDQVQRKIDALKAEKQELNRQAMAGAGELREVSQEISRLAKAMGGASLGG